MALHKKIGDFFSIIAIFRKWYKT